MERAQEYAVIYWPETGVLATIARQHLWGCSIEGALLIADERDIFAEVVETEPMQSNPRRHDDDGA